MPWHDSGYPDSSQRESPHFPLDMQGGLPSNVEDYFFSDGASQSLDDWGTAMAMGLGSYCTGLGKPLLNSPPTRLDSQGSHPWDSAVLHQPAPLNISGSLLSQPYDGSSADALAGGHAQKAPRSVVGSKKRNDSHDLLRHNSAPKHQCTWCDKRLARKSGLRDHILRHENEFSFACGYLGCDARFNTAGDRRSHNRKRHGAGQKIARK
ncbi:hypothetical protein EV121DRAFT_291160 [Schizophyllum commune]